MALVGKVMKKHEFWKNTSFTEALALTIISISLVTSNYYRLLATESDIQHKQNQIAAPEQSN